MWSLVACRAGRGVGRAGLRGLPLVHGRTTNTTHTTTWRAVSSTAAQLAQAQSRAEEGMHAQQQPQQRRPVEEVLPFASPLSKILRPGAYVRWSMGTIDQGRHCYELCSTPPTSLVRYLALPSDEFQSWYSVTLLHMWMLSTRLRAEGPMGRLIRQEMYNHLWPDTEMRLSKFGVKLLMNKICKQLMSLYYGQMLGYDEGLWAGDAELASAFWRNILPRRDPSAQQLEALTTYVNANLRHLEGVAREDILTANFSFLPLEEVLPHLDIPASQPLYAETAGAPVPDSVKEAVSA